MKQYNLNPLESAIQADITKKLRSFGYIIIRLRSVDKAGWPDIMALKNGKTTFVEVKRPGKQPTPLQLQKHKQLQDAGFKVLVLDGRELLSEYF